MSNKNGNIEEVLQDVKPDSFVCKVCGCIDEYSIISGGRKKCKCGKIAKRKLVDVLYTKFHTEIKTEPIKREMIIDRDIIIYDSSESMISRKSKYKSKNCIILFKYDIECMSEPEIMEIEAELEKLNSSTNKYSIKDKMLCWISGMVLVDQLDQMREKKQFPTNNGFEARLVSEHTDDGSYYKFE